MKFSPNERNIKRASATSFMIRTTCNIKGKNKYLINYVHAYSKKLDNRPV